MVLFLNGNQVAGTNTDFDGEYTIKPINLDVRRVFSTRATVKKVTGWLFPPTDPVCECRARSRYDDGGSRVVEYSVPLIDKDGGASGGTVVAKTSTSFRDVQRRASRKRWRCQPGGTGGGVSIRGARTSSTWYYIDKIKVRGSLRCPNPPSRKFRSSQHPCQHW